MPSLNEALQRLERALVLARQESCGVLKLLHGYGSSGVGGDIRIAVQKRLFEMADRREIRGYIFGEDWGRSHEQSWRLIQSRPELKRDRDLGRKNPGISIVVL